MDTTQEVVQLEAEVVQLESECSSLRSSISNCNNTLRNLGQAIKEYYHVNELTGDLGRYVGTTGKIELPAPTEVRPEVARDPFKKQA